MDYVIQHHGIKGQKWGIRRFQNPDGSLTPEGEKRYNQLNKKGKYQKYDSYKNLTKEDKFTAQYKNDKIKKALMIAGGVALTAGMVYAGKRYYQNNVDSVIKAGTKMQTVLNSPTIDTGKQFYTAINGLDKVRYGALGAQMGINTNDVYKHKMTVSKNFKIASNKSGKEVFDDLMKSDSSFAKEVNDVINNLPSYFANPKYNKMVGDAKSGKNKYNAFNNMLAGNGGFTNDSVRNKFYDALKKKGYSAVRDINDTHYTNYHSINPAIVFDGKNIINKIDTSKLTEKEYKTGYSIVAGQAWIPVIRNLAIETGIGVTAYNMRKNTKDAKTVDDYRKNHSDNKSYEDIIKNKKSH